MPITLSTSFSIDNTAGINLLAIDANRIWTGYHQTSSGTTTFTIKRYTHAGVEQTTEQITFTRTDGGARLASFCLTDTGFAFNQVATNGLNIHVYTLTGNTATHDRTLFVSYQDNRSIGGGGIFYDAANSRFLLLHYDATNGQQFLWVDDTGNPTPTTSDGTTTDIPISGIGLALSVNTALVACTFGSPNAIWAFDTSDFSLRETISSLTLNTDTIDLSTAELRVIGANGVTVVFMARGSGSQTLYLGSYSEPAPANNAPEFAEATYSFNDVAIANGTVVGTITATDDDADTLTYSLTGTDQAKFSVDADGEITNAEELDYSTVYNFNIVAEDAEDSDSAAVVVTTQADPNNAPVFANDAQTFNIDANPSIGDVIGTITATDDDNDTLTYELSGTDAERFAVDADGEITIAMALANNTAYMFVLTATDPSDASDTINITVNVGRPPPNNPPEFASSTQTIDVANSVMENDNIGSPIVATDADSDTLTYSVTSGSANFNVDNNGQITAARDLEDDFRFVLVVTASDDRGGTDTVTVTVNVGTPTDPIEPEPVTPTGERQLYLLDKGEGIIDFDLVTRTSGALLEEIKKANIACQVKTTSGFDYVIPNKSVFISLLSDIEVIPVFTIPDVEAGDYLILPEDTPGIGGFLSQLDIWAIEAIRYVGDNAEQIFICKRGLFG